MSRLDFGWIGSPSFGAFAGAGTLTAIALLAMALSQSTIPTQGARPFERGLRGLEAPPDPAPAEPGRAKCRSEAEFPYLYLHSGEVHLEAVDLRIPGVGLDFVWARKYRSRSGPDTAQGVGWDHSYAIWIEMAGADVRVHDGGSRADVYTSRPDGSYVARQFFREGRFELDGTFTLTFADLGHWTFRPLTGTAPGRIQSIIDRNGNALTCGYDGSGRLTSITDTLGRVVTVAYAGSRIASVTDFTGRSVTYAYYQSGDLGGAPGDLKSATSPPVVGTPNGNDFPAGKTTVYTYTKGFGDDRLNHNLLTVTDPRGQTWLVNEYGAAASAGELLFDRVVRQRIGNPTDTIEVSYVPLRIVLVGDASAAVARVIVNDRVGNVREYFYDGGARLVAKREFTGRADPALFTTVDANRPTNKLRADDPDWFETRWSWNEDALVTQISHPGGNVTRNVYELELDSNAAWRARGNLREVRRLPGTHVPVGDQAAGTVELFEYASGLGGCCAAGFVTRHTDARGHLTVHVYDAAGNRTQTQHPLGIVEDWTYDARGRITTHTLPDNGSGHRRIDELRWYGPGDGPQNGYLKEAITDSGVLSLTTRREYDARGNLVREIDPNNNDRLSTFNALNQVVRVLSPSLPGAPAFRIATLSWYDANDNLERVDVENRSETGALDPNPFLTTTYAYGILNERTSMTEEVAVGATVVTEYGYDANRNRTLMRSPEATAGSQPQNTLTTLYDERDLLWRATRAAGSSGQSTVQTDYDRNRRVRAVRAGLESGPHVRTYVYDALDRLVSTLDPMGNLTEHHYDPNGNLGGNVGGDASAANPFGTRVTGEFLDASATTGTVRLHEVQYAYDALDRLIRRDIRHFDTQSQAVIGDGQSTTFVTWSPNSQIRTVVGDGVGQTTGFDYDTADRLLRATDARNNTTLYGYDAKGNVVQLVQTELSDLGAPAQAFTNVFSYDTLDRLQTHVDGVGNALSWQHDSRGNRVLAIDPLNRRSRYSYDGLDRLIRVAQDMNGNSVFTDFVDVILDHEWDRNSRRIRDIDDRGNSTRYAYDALDRLIVTQMADGTIEQIGTGATWTLGQPAPNLAGFVSGYDIHDDIVLRRDAAGSQVASSYDALDRAVTRTITRGPNVLGTTGESRQYDGLSRGIVFQDDDSLVTRGSATTNGYDSLDRVLRETQQILPPGGVTHTVTATYDGRGNQTQLVYPSGRVIVRTFDALERPLLVRDNPSPTIATYAYRGPERLERRDYGNGTRLTPTYDGVDGVPNGPSDFGVRRLVRTLHQVIAGGATLTDRTYRHDRAGNKTQAQDPVQAQTRTYTYDALDRLIGSNVVPGGPAMTYVLDGAGNRTSVSGGPDAGAYAAANAVNFYTSTPFDTRAPDPNGNLFSQTSPTRSYRYDYMDRLVQYFDDSTGATTNYRHDGLGRRTEKATGATITRHYYDGGEEIEERSGTNVTLATFVYSKGRHSRLQMAIPSTGAKYYYHEDDLGSVRTVTDSTAQVVESVDYDDFGKPTVTSATTPGSLTQPPNQSGMHDSDLDGGAGSFSIVTAENFTVSQPWQLAGLRWWGTYDQAAPPATDDFWIEIRADVGGLPGALIAQRHVGNAVARTPTGLLIVGFYTEYSYLAAISPTISLSPGVPYWLVVHGNSAGYSGTWRWEQGSAGNGQAAINFNSQGWNPTGGDTAFELQLQSGPPASGNPFLYRGQRWDVETKSSLTPVGAMEPRAGRFESRDQPMIAALGNPYTYAANNPLASHAPSLAPAWNMLALSLHASGGGFPLTAQLQDPDDLKKKAQGALVGVIVEEIGRWLIRWLLDVLHPDCGPTTIEVHGSGEFDAEKGTSTESESDSIRKTIDQRLLEKVQDGCTKGCLSLQCHKSNEVCKFTSFLATDRSGSTGWGTRKGPTGEEYIHVSWAAYLKVDCRCECK